MDPSVLTHCKSCFHQEYEERDGVREFQRVAWPCQSQLTAWYGHIQAEKTGVSQEDCA